MSPVDTNKPHIIKFLVENYEREAKLRMKWNDNNAEILKLTATFRGPEKGYTENQVQKSIIESGIAATTQDFISSTRNRIRVPHRDSITVKRIADLREGHTISSHHVGLGDPNDDPRLSRPNTDMSLDPIMRPVPPEQKQIIYDGIPNFGRLEYLKVRNLIKPEDKYYFQETMGWAYGWRQNDSYFGKNHPMYGRVAKVSKGIQSRTGPQADCYDACDVVNHV